MTYHRTHHYRPDRHGRGMRGVLVPPGLPGFRTRSEQFDELAIAAVSDIAVEWEAVNDIEFAVEDVPPSDPAPWEDHAVVFGRCFPAERAHHLKTRIVLYRLPIQGRCRTRDELRDTLRWVIVENVANALAVPPDALIPRQWELGL
ncbi:MAG: metallopeptidase family protein [Actinomycetaceae bacterium]|nr:metallopeptidase family protein [Actinomycetaceae bacterium]MDU0969704.1 metallopeptidase family protein [Actinomycetaceae bacterium]